MIINNCMYISFSFLFVVVSVLTPDCSLCIHFVSNWFQTIHIISIAILSMFNFIYFQRIPVPILDSYPFINHFFGLFWSIFSAIDLRLDFNSFSIRDLLGKAFLYFVFFGFGACIKERKGHERKWKQRAWKERKWTYIYIWTHTKNCLLCVLPLY